MPLDEEGWNAPLECVPIIRDDFLFSQAHLSPPIIPPEPNAFPSMIRPLCGIGSERESADRRTTCRTKVPSSVSAFVQLSRYSQGGLQVGCAGGVQEEGRQMGIYQTSMNGHSGSSGVASPSSSSFISQLNSNSASASPPEIAKNFRDSLIERHQEEYGGESGNGSLPTSFRLSDLQYNGGPASDNTSLAIKQESCFDAEGPSSHACEYGEIDGGVGDMLIYPQEGSKSFRLDSGIDEENSQMTGDEDFMEEERKYSRVLSPSLYQLPQPPAKIRSKMHDLALAHRLITNQVGTI